MFSLNDKYKKKVVGSIDTTIKDKSMIDFLGESSMAIVNVLNTVLNKPENKAKTMDRNYSENILFGDSEHGTSTIGSIFNKKMNPKRQEIMNKRFKQEGKIDIDKSDLVKLVPNKETKKIDIIDCESNLVMPGFKPSEIREMVNAVEVLLNLVVKYK